MKGRRLRTDHSSIPTTTENIRRNVPEVAEGTTDSARPSRAQLSVAATLLLSITTFGLVLGPRKGDVAQAADPQLGSPRYDAVARGDQPPIQLSKDIDLRNARTGGQDELQERDTSTGGRTYISPDDRARMHRVQIGSNQAGNLSLGERPELRNRLSERFIDLTQGNNYVFYTIDPQLQTYVEQVIDQAQASHVAIVAMNPRTGAILAMAGKSRTVRDVEYHSGFPAASLFKVVTAAAAVEQAGVRPDSMIAFRGGNYTLTEANYLPNPRLDRRFMTVGEALGRSCNPVFGQLGVRYLNTSILSKYARLFGFNRSLELEAPLQASNATIPADDLYEFSRTSAGFGNVHISPIHAATLMSGIANGGLLPRPRMVDKVVSADGAVLHRPRPEVLQRIVQPATASTLLEMMENTTTIGTSRREFNAGSRPTLGTIQVAAKTGTLKGDNPVGLNNWFIAAAPISNPELAIAVITVDPRFSSKASHLGRRVFERYFHIAPSEPERVFVRTTSHGGRTTKRTGYHSIKTKKGAKKSAVAAKPSKAPKASKKSSAKGKHR